MAPVYMTGQELLAMSPLPSDADADPALRELIGTMKSDPLVSWLNALASLDATTFKSLVGAVLIRNAAQGCLKPVEAGASVSLKDYPAERIMKMHPAEFHRVEMGFRQRAMQTADPAHVKEWITIQKYWQDKVQHFNEVVRKVRNEMGLKQTIPSAPSVMGIPPADCPMAAGRRLH